MSDDGFKVIHIWSEMKHCETLNSCRVFMHYVYEQHR